MTGERPVEVAGPLPPREPEEGRHQLGEARCPRRLLFGCGGGRVLARLAAAAFAAASAVSVARISAVAALCLAVVRLVEGGIVPGGDAALKRKKILTPMNHHNRLRQEQFERSYGGSLLNV